MTEGTSATAKTLDLDSRIDNLLQSLEAHEWEKAGLFLGQILEEASYEALENINLGFGVMMRRWIDALVMTGLCTSSDKGRFLFMKIVRTLW